jgi:hypothetical protein
MEQQQNSVNSLGSLVVLITLLISTDSEADTVTV